MKSMLTSKMPTTTLPLMLLLLALVLVALVTTKSVSAEHIDGHILSKNKQVKYDMRDLVKHPKQHKSCATCDLVDTLLQRGLQKCVARYCDQNNKMCDVCKTGQSLLPLVRTACEDLLCTSNDICDNCKKGKLLLDELTNICESVFCTDKKNDMCVKCHVVRALGDLLFDKCEEMYCVNMLIHDKPSKGFKFIKTN
jgi:hypothetical protein